MYVLCNLTAACQGCNLCRSRNYIPSIISSTSDVISQCWCTECVQAVSSLFLASCLTSANVWETDCIVPTNMASEPGLSAFNSADAALYVTAWRNHTFHMTKSVHQLPKLRPVPAQKKPDINNKSTRGINKFKRTSKNNTIHVIYRQENICPWPPLLGSRYQDLLP